MKKLIVVALVSLAAGIVVARTLDLTLDFAGALPDQVTVQRACYPGTLDAVYVARSFEGSISMQVVPGGCTRRPPIPPYLTNR